MFRSFGGLELKVLSCRSLGFRYFGSWDLRLRVCGCVGVLGLVLASAQRSLESEGERSESMLRCFRKGLGFVGLRVEGVGSRV